ncbi:hypothetical protein ACFXAF_01080 [Kitasatospora sp. NPDC059463]|uniref:hypothetical protein n=1 Tax=Kitasatospora TaxID=2063 RepID=UPI0035DF7D53
MPPKKPAAPAWQEVPGAQEIMDRALPLLGAARAREYEALAAVVFETALLFTNSEGRPDLSRSSHNAKRWMSDLLDAGGFKPVPGDSKERREKLAADRQAVLQGVRTAMSKIRVDYIRSMDTDSAERDHRFPGLPDSDAIFAYYKIIPKAQSELRLEDYHRRTSLQRLGALLADDEPSIAPADGPDVVHALHRLATALAPALLDGADAQEKAQLRREIGETRAALLALEESLS